MWDLRTGVVDIGNLEFLHPLIQSGRHSKDGSLTNSIITKASIGQIEFRTSQNAGSRLRPTCVRLVLVLGL